MVELTPVAAEVVARVRRRGPIPFDEVVDLALYDPDHGFYASGAGRPGRRGDFLTSPEVGPLFGAVLARALDSWWHELGSPDRFTVIEAAAGTGTMARSLLAAAPACAPALTYVLVERAASLRRRHVDHLEIIEPTMAFVPDDEDGPARPAATGGFARRRADRGPRVVSLPDLPAIPVVGIVLANELLDNLGFGLLERGDAGWSEVRVGVSESAAGPQLVEVLVPASERDARMADRLAPGAAPGSRVPTQRQAAEWLSAAYSRIERGEVVVIDYGDRTAGLAARPMREWVRTYRGHARAGGPLDALGLQDVTCEVAFDQLELVHRPSRTRSQAEFLESHGIGVLVEEGRRTWHERAHLGDLAAVRARSRIGEGEALLDPSGLGAFEVLEWQIG